MAIDTNIQEFTDAELLKLCRKAIAEIMVYGTSVGSNGKSLSRADLTALRETQTDLESRVSAAESATLGNGGGIALAQLSKAT